MKLTILRRMKVAVTAVFLFASCVTTVSVWAVEPPIDSIVLFNVDRDAVSKVLSGEYPLLIGKGARATIVPATCTFRTDRDLGRLAAIVCSRRARRNVETTRTVSSVLRGCSRSDPWRLSRSTALNSG